MKQSQSSDQSQDLAHLGLIIVVLAVIIAAALIGWYVWQRSEDNGSNQTNNATQETNPQGSPNSNNRSQDQKVIRSTESWTSYSNPEGKFSVKYPSSWKLPTNFESCPKNVLLLGPTEDTTGICQSDKTSQVKVSSDTGDQLAAQRLHTTDFYDIAESNVKVRGVDGKKYAGVYNVKDDLLPRGTKLVRYVFYTNDRTYVAEYWQTPDYPDVQEDFDVIIDQTLKFSE